MNFVFVFACLCLFASLCLLLRRLLLSFFTIQEHMRATPVPSLIYFSYASSLFSLYSSFTVTHLLDISHKMFCFGH
ncbi:hypothetical protein BKA57DRAFT_445821, partial [Linnemannia elongata]